MPRSRTLTRTLVSAVLVGCDPGTGPGGGSGIDRQISNPGNPPYDRGTFEVRPATAAAITRTCTVGVRGVQLVLAGLVAVLTLTVQQAWRPAVPQGHLAGVLGWLPSLLYGFGVVLAAHALLGLHRRVGAWVGLGAVLYECLQPWLPGRTFDPLDLLATLAGVTIALRVAESGSAACLQSAT